MVRKQVKPFSKTELKILVFNKMKQGMSYQKAVEQVREHVKLCMKNHNDHRDKQKTKNFKEEFNNLKNGQ